jgi:hypothetical protein
MTKQWSLGLGATLLTSMQSRVAADCRCSSIAIARAVGPALSDLPPSGSGVLSRACGRPRRNRSNVAYACLQSEVSSATLAP